MNKKVFLVLAAACPLWAFGQKSTTKNMTDSIYSLDEVSVVGKHKKPLQDHPVNLLKMDVPLKFLPMTMTRLDHATMERKHIVNMEDAVRFLPGVVMSSDQLGAFQRYSIRGTSDAVIAYDGIRDERSLINTAPFGDLSSVESIEVIKGPASVLAGHSVMGGVINIISKKPSDRFRANASLSYGSWNQKEATVGFGGKLAGPVNYYANVHYGNGDGYRMVNSDRFSGMFALGSKIGKKGYLDANISFNDDHYTTDIGGAPTMPGDVKTVDGDKLFAASGQRNPLCNYESVYNDIANNKMRQRNLDMSVTYTQPLTAWVTLRDRFSYGHSNLDYACVENVKYRTSEKPIYNWYYLGKNNVKTYIEVDSVRSGAPLDFNPDYHNITNTFDLTGRFETGSVKHNYTLGWNYSYLDFTQYNGYGKGDQWGPGLNQMVSVENPHYVGNWWDSKVSAAAIYHRITNGIYLTDVIDINEHWKGMLSGRFDTYAYKNASATISDGRQHYDEANRTDWKEVFTAAFTYRAGLVYLPVEPVSIYASAASYFKPYNTIYNPKYIYYDRDGNEFKPDENGGEVYRPERGNQFEIGARYESKLLEVNASVYYIRKFNVVTKIGEKTIENGADVEKLTVQAQVGQAESKGFDVDVTVHPVSTLQIVAGMGWSDYRKKASNMDWIPKDADWVTLNEDGTINIRAINVPRTTFYTYADYTIPRGILKDLSFHLSGTFTDRIYRDIGENLYDPPRYIVDAGIYYTIKKKLTLSCNVNNVLNSHYFSSTTRLAKPHNFIATISYNL